MADQEIVPPPQRMPQNQVVVNGAAVNLLGQLTEGIRSDMRAMERRITEDFRARLVEHLEVHEILEHDLIERRVKVDKRLGDLEEDDEEDDRLLALAKERQRGRLDVVVWVRDNRTWLAPLLLMLGGALIGGIAGQELSSGT